MGFKYLRGAKFLCEKKQNVQEFVTPNGNNYAPTNIFTLIDYGNNSMLRQADVEGRGRKHF